MGPKTGTTGWKPATVVILLRPVHPILMVNASKSRLSALVILIAMAVIVPELNPAAVRSAAR